MIEAEMRPNIDQHAGKSGVGQYDRADGKLRQSPEGEGWRKLGHDPSSLRGMARPEAPVPCRSSSGKGKPV